MPDETPPLTRSRSDETEAITDQLGRRNLLAAPRLMPGDVLGRRFTIVQFLARGGMGEVYEASDSHLQNKHCALKILRGEIAIDPHVRQRFEREVLLAREVTHPNVCPTFDMFREDAPPGPLLFLTMRLVRGEPLSTRLQRAGPFQPESALPLVRQMAAGLDAAHRAGVIHRDFKPGNVMLEGRDEETRVLITDFGLSREYESDHTLANPGEISGTIGYIAPELLQGSTATPAADVYALGVVVHEMLTGRRPVVKPGSNRFLPPSHFVESLPRFWDRMVLGCIEPDPLKRFQSAGEALAALESRSGSTRTARASAASSPRRKIGIASTAAVMLAAALWFGAPRLDSILHPLPQKRFVALMEWPPPASPQYIPLLKNVLAATGNRLARAEASSKDLLIISPGDVTGQAPPRKPADVMTALGANLVLTASVQPLGNGVALSLRVLDPATQAVLREKKLSASPTELSALPERAARASAKLLDVTIPASGRQEGDELAGVPPPAYLLFTSAEDLMSQPNDAGLDQAIEKYQKALDLAPHFALAYAKLAMAYVRKFLKSKDAAVLNLAQRNAQLAMQHDPDSAQSLLSQALVDVNSGRAQEAIGELGKALQINPGNPQIALAKARALRDLNRRAEEEDLYHTIIAERPNFWPAYNELGLILYRHGSYQKAAEAFAEGAAIAPKVALLPANVGAMELLLGHKKEAQDAFLQSLKRGPNEIADQNLGSIAFSAGDYRRALEYYTKASELRPERDSTWRNIADCYAMMGDRQREKENYQKAADRISDSLRLNPNPASNWMTLAFYQAKLGLFPQARNSLKESDSRGAGDMQSQFKKAQVLAVLGNKDEALRLVLDCIQKGLSPEEVDLALDLKAIRNDAKYKSLVAQTRPKH